MDVDLYLQVYKTRDETAHVCSTYLTNPDALNTPYHINVYQALGSFDPDNINWNAGSLYEYEDVKPYWCLEGDFHDDWFNCSNNTTYHFVAIIYLTNDNIEYYYTYDFRTLIDLPTPSNLVYDSSTNQLTFSSSESTSTARIVEFERTDDYNPTNTTEEQRLLFYLASLVNIETGYNGYIYSNVNILYRWNVGVHTVGVYCNSSCSFNYSNLLSKINNAIDLINDALSGTGVSFSVFEGTGGEIQITIGTHEELWGWTPSLETGWYNGTWSTTSSNGYIIHSNVKIRGDEIWHETWAGIIMEELYESLGCGYDQTEIINDTINSEFIFYNKNNYISSFDQGVIDILYKNNLSVGLHPYEVAVLINSPKGNKNTVNNYLNMNFLTNNAPYRARVWLINPTLNKASLTSDWVYFTSNCRPTNFAWNTPKISGDPTTNLLASEWTNLQNKVNEFRQYKSLSIFTFTNVTSGGIFYASLFNQVRNNIYDMNVVNLPSTKLGISDVVDPNDADYILASDLNNIVSCLNAIE